MDDIPVATYKILPTARAYVIYHIPEIINGTKSMKENEVRARVTLIFKDVDPSYPVNYRLIAVLNTKYKFLTAVISDIILV